MKNDARTTTRIKMPPQDLSAERAFLGSLMIKPTGMHDIEDLIMPDDFYALKHKLIYKAMLALSERGDPIDIVSVTSILSQHKQMETAGGSSYLGELIEAVPSAANLKHYAEIVQKKSSLRTLINSADLISELGYNEQEEIDSIFDQAQKIIFNAGGFTKKRFTNIKEGLAEAWDRFEMLSKMPNGIRGITSGFPDLDSKLSGFQKSDLIILAARPSMGKTSLALNIACNAAIRNKVPVGIFSLEMSTQQLVDRVISAESFVDSWKLRNGKVSSDEELMRIRDALATLSQAPIYIDDESSNNVAKMKAEARRLKSEFGLGLIIVDYLQLMVPRRESDSTVQQVTEISRSLKQMARELEIPVIALSQLNRSVEQRGGRPRLSDLRDSGSIEQDADVVMFIHREDKMNESSDRKNIAEILIEKHRNGPTGKVELYFDEKITSFVPVDKQHGDFGSF
ncbi:MAG: replicative DNA helicase [Candidatus Vogelbacteria bacterium CG22_combo_CG10-13_8_21_14_all_37_9]|uniref:Replicative DNA helicase n=1 Tax=Candidatus Vogelbacteria bacterium CG22_combo_CG10-13_8_21_14_all_37_9 TaxID=1975046 RepID=A0A2H0BMT0_9BACT|nr:MAG: replicative DNA helicase [bacterium CG10_37_50]PIP58308.1 MAG: replicative DNA helicase [Candidatus Vogelbacteria bacterium CG22_combo_CG10-13_8_21_14_all_37_9]